MAKSLHDDFGFSYDNVKVLKGGLTAWEQQNAVDSKTYPIEPPQQ